MTSKNYSRRNFIQNGTLASIAASTGIISGFAKSNLDLLHNMNKKTTIKKSFPAAEKLMTLLNIKYPIIQAPTGGILNSSFSAAVANTGALGAMALSWSEPDYAVKQIQAIKAKTNNSYFANFVLNFEPKAFDIAIEHGVPIIQFSWGMPTVEMVEKMKAAKLILGIQVTSESSARTAIDLGADYLVCQGVEAGGHVHGSRPLEEALKRVLRIAGEIPVVASGGIATGHKMRFYMEMGAAGVVMGSRFVATQESRAHAKYKESLVVSKAEDTVFTTCMNKGFENTTHRILRNSTFDMWESAGCPAVGTRPGEKDIVSNFGPDHEVERYSINSPHMNYTGDIEAMANYAGTGVNDIHDIPTVATLIERIWKEFLNE